MSKRSIYLLGALAVVAGTVLIAFAIAALTSDGGDSSDAQNEAGTTSQQVTPGPAPAPQAPAERGPQEQGIEARGSEVGEQLARRRPVRAPALSARLIEAGSIPKALQARFERAAGEGTLTLSQLRGTPVVLHLWSSQCEPCRANARLVEATWKRWGARGVLFVGMLVDEAPASTTRKVIRQYDLTYPAVSGSTGIAHRYGATALPQTFFISSGGAIVGQVVGTPSVRQLEVGAAAAQSGQPFGSEQGSARAPLG